MNFKKLADQAKSAIDKRGGTEALKGDLAEARGAARGKGTMKEKAKAAADAVKAPRARPGTDAPPTARDLPPRH